MGLFEIKHRHTDEVLYSGEAESIKKLLEKAVKENANLRYADLRNADLRYAILEKANLQNANLENSNLRYADLRYADLQNANLENSNLQDANLRYADLRNANLQNANLENSKLENANLVNSIKMPMRCKWSHGITDKNRIHIGCEQRTIEEWDVFFASKEILSTPRNTPEFKQIEAVYLAYKAYLTHLAS